MVQVGVLEARNNLSRYVREVECGLENMVIIQRNGVPVAKIVPFEEEHASSRRLGVAKDKMLYRGGWDSKQLDAEIAELFEGAL
jgi:prevent-host-death family protein